MSSARKHAAVASAPPRLFQGRVRCDDLASRAAILDVGGDRRCRSDKHTKVFVESNRHIRRNKKPLPSSERDGTDNERTTWAAVTESSSINDMTLYALMLCSGKLCIRGCRGKHRRSSSGRVMAYCRGRVPIFLYTRLYSFEVGTVRRIQQCLKERYNERSTALTHCASTN